MIQPEQDQGSFEIMSENSKLDLKPAADVADYDNIDLGPESLNVWLVDDNDDYRQLLADLLGKEQGIECSRNFQSADAALSALASKSGPDVLLLDIQMKGQSGLDAIRPIKSLARETRVVMLTTFYDSERHSRAIRAGASDFLLKSYELKDLVERIRKQEAAENMPLHLRNRHLSSEPASASVPGAPRSERHSSSRSRRTGKNAKPESAKDCSSNWFSRRLKFFNGLLG
jgi:DNA-binding NarL/FixJ family response regulator